MTRMGRNLIAIALAAGLSGPAMAADVFKIDKAHTNIVFFVSHFGYSKMVGQFNDFSGTFEFDQGNVGNSKVSLVIKAASVDTDHDKRDQHLRSPDFLNAAEFPEITFKSTKSEKTGDKTGKITGDLTILGKTRPVTLDVTFNKIAPHPVPFYKGVVVAGFSARAKVDRHEFGISYGKGALGAVLDLYLEVEGHKQ